MSKEFNFEEIKNKALEQLKFGKSLLGKDGAFAPLLESILNAALQGEMDVHMDDHERSLGNRVSAETISSITDRVLLEIQAWRSPAFGKCVCYCLDGCYSLQSNG